MFQKCAINLFYHTIYTLLENELLMLHVAVISRRCKNQEFYLLFQRYFWWRDLVCEHWNTVSEHLNWVCYFASSVVFSTFVTRQRSWSFAEYWKYFVARFNDVHVFGYNFAGGEWIWMKFGEVLSILLGAGPDRFWAQSAQKRERETLRKFCFFVR